MKVVAKGREQGVLVSNPVLVHIPGLALSGPVAKIPNRTDILIENKRRAVPRNPSNPVMLYDGLVFPVTSKSFGVMINDYYENACRPNSVD
jgi:hypothetical protein